MNLMLNGRAWKIQVVLFELEHGYEILHVPGIIRVSFCEDSDLFAWRVALAVGCCAAMPVYGSVS